MITHEIHPEDGIVIVKPGGPLTAKDFERLTESVDAYLGDHGAINGLLIHAKEFPGWKNFGGFVHHMRFVKEHHRRIAKIAVVTDDKLASFGPQIARHFVAAEVEAFGYDDYAAALNWLRPGAP